MMTFEEWFICRSRLGRYLERDWNFQLRNKQCDCNAYLSRSDISMEHFRAIANLLLAEESLFITLSQLHASFYFCMICLLTKLSYEPLSWMHSSKENGARISAPHSDGQVWIHFRTSWIGGSWDRQQKDAPLGRRTFFSLYLGSNLSETIREWACLLCCEQGSIPEALQVH